jgi:rhodanese-related sulfurtransferase
MVNNMNPIIPAQPPIEAQTDVKVVKSRLEWGEPAFTIMDVRDRPTYNQGHIMGAIPVPIDEMRETEVSSLDIDKSRDIYVYGNDEGQTALAAQSLRSAGFKNVSELLGGIAAWKAIGGTTEGIIESKNVYT